MTKNLILGGESYNQTIKQKIASNGLIIDSNIFVSLNASGKLVRATAGTQIEGFVNYLDSFASNNETVAKKKLSYIPRHEIQKFKIVVNAPITDDDLGYYYDLDGTADQKIDFATKSPTVGQFMLDKVVDNESGEFSYVSIYRSGTSGPTGPAGVTGGPGIQGVGIDTASATAGVTPAGTNVVVTLNKSDLSSTTYNYIIPWIPGQIAWLDPLPATGTEGVLYISPINGAMQYWDGGAYQSAGGASSIIERYVNSTAFPGPGDPTKIYIARDTSIMYEYKTAPTNDYVEFGFRKVSPTFAGLPPVGDPNLLYFDDTTKKYYQRDGTTYKPFGSQPVNDGLSVDVAGAIVLGQKVGEAGNPGQLLTPREIPLNGQKIRYKGSTGKVSSHEDNGDVVAGGDLYINSDNNGNTKARYSKIDQDSKNAGDLGGIRSVHFADSDSAIVGNLKIADWSYPRNTAGVIQAFHEDRSVRYDPTTFEHFNTIGRSKDGNYYLGGESNTTDTPDRLSANTIYPLLQDPTTNKIYTGLVPQETEVKISYTSPASVLITNADLILFNVSGIDFYRKTNTFNLPNPPYNAPAGYAWYVSMNMISEGYGSGLINIVLVSTDATVLTLARSQLHTLVPGGPLVVRNAITGLILAGNTGNVMSVERSVGVATGLIPFTSAGNINFQFFFENLTYKLLRTI